MRKKFNHKAVLAFVLVSLLAVNLVKGDYDDRFDEEFDDGLVEDVQDDNLESAGGSTEKIVYESPQYDPKQFYFADHFDNVEESMKRWVQSEAKKDDIPEEIAKYDGEWSWEPPQRIVWKNDKGLVLKSKAKHAAIASKLSKVFDFKGEKPLIVQYEVQLQDGQDCGGSYIKLLSHGDHLDNLVNFNDKTPYTIMFGPDKCGNDIKMHFIFRHVNPINGTITEKHCQKPKDRLEEPFKDKMPHLYQLIVRPDNTFEIRVDHKIINEGSLLTEFTPPVNPPKEIDDPEDKKPDDWDEREKIPDPAANKPDDWDENAPPQIPDPTAVKPEGWLDDEPEMIPDPAAKKPEDWDTEIDGEWEAPLVDNPVCEKAAGCGVWSAPMIPNVDYKGKWHAPLIENPNYQGKWAPRKIPNPDFFEDLTPFRMTPISAVGIELWSMSSDILFDNLIITDDLNVAREFAAKSFDIKRKYIAKESDSFLSKLLDYAKEYPIAWKIALVMMVVPFAFTFYTLCSKGARKEPDAKKTDAIQPDDELEIIRAKLNEQKEAAAAAAESVLSAAKAKAKAKKSDLEVKFTEEEQDPAAADEPESSDKSEDNDEAEAEAAISEENEETVTTQKTSSGPRKRQLRKD